METRTKRFRILLLSLPLILAACEEVIYPTLEPANPVLVVDAWISNAPGTQAIVLSRTQPYFDATVPPPLSGATVSVLDELGHLFVFAEGATPGRYEWMPSGADTLRVGGKYQLSVTVGTETFEAASYMGRVPAIDSVTFERDKNIATGDSITRAEFWATDPAGHGDAYWIRTWKNGIPLLKPNEINIAFDAGLSVGGPADGVIFIAPIRRRINSIDEDEDGSIKSPIADGDSVYVQMHSVTVAAFTYLNEVAIQTNRPGGFAELFATPLANVSTNLFNTDPDGSRVVGFFNVAAVSAKGNRYTQ
jgi:hypothetical protein